jgi:hypothetical protein
MTGSTKQSIAPQRKYGLLRFARNDADGVGQANSDLIAPQLCAQDERSKRPEIRASCGFLGHPGLVFSHPIRFHCHSFLIAH